MTKEPQTAIIPGFSRYYARSDGLIFYAGTDKRCPDYEDGKNGYRKIKIYPDGAKKRKIFFVSRLIWQAFYGSIPPKIEVDHADGDILNNSLDNLILATHKQNCMLKKQRDNKSLFYRKNSKRYSGDGTQAGLFN